MSQHQKEIGKAEGTTKHVIPVGGNLFEVRSGSEGFTVDKGKRAFHGINFWPDQTMYSTVLPPKPRKMSGKPRNKRFRYVGEGGSSTRVSKRVPVRDEGACGLEEVLEGLEVELVFQEELVVGLEEVLVYLVVLVGQKVEQLMEIVKGG
ncbi:hypothetical protein Tco_0562276 [Tanacetum coccineum]